MAGIMMCVSTPPTQDPNNNLVNNLISRAIDELRFVDNDRFVDCCDDNTDLLCSHSHHKACVQHALGAIPFKPPVITKCLNKLI